MLLERQEKPWPGVAELPGKVFWRRFDPEVLEERKVGLHSWISGVIKLFGPEPALLSFLEFLDGDETPAETSDETKHGSGSDQVVDVAVLYEKELQSIVASASKRMVNINLMADPASTSLKWKILLDGDDDEEEELILDKEGENCPLPPLCYAILTREC